MAKIDDVMQEFLNNVDEVLMSMIVNLDDAIPITGHTTDESIDVTVPLAFLTEVARKAMSAFYCKICLIVHSVQLISTVLLWKIVFQNHGCAIEPEGFSKLIFNVF